MKPDELRLASLYLYQGRALVQPLGRTTRGAWIPSGPVTDHPAEPLEALETVLEAALALSCQGLPHPQDWAPIMEPLLDASGAKKWPDFLKVARCLGIEQRGREISVVPTRNLGEEGGFEPLVPEAVPMGRAGTGQLTRAMREAIPRCS